jgi:hypothetical protein
MKIRVNHIIRQVCLTSFVFLSLSSCNLRKEEKPVSPPLTFPLSQSYIGYGVINVSYTRLSAGIEENSSSAGYLRQGSVVRIIERRLVKTEAKTEAWVLVASVEGSTKGWLKESLMDIYGNESQAVTAAKSMSSEQ